MNQIYHVCNYTCVYIYKHMYRGYFLLAHDLSQPKASYSLNLEPPVSSEVK